DKMNPEKWMQSVEGKLVLGSSSDTFLKALLLYLEYQEGAASTMEFIQRFSRWVEACPTKRKDAQSVAKFLCREVISRWGLPERISSDNGKEFEDKTAPRQETSTLQEGDAEGSGEPRGDGGQCGEEEMQDESQSQSPEEDMVHGGGIIYDSVCTSNDVRSDTTDGDEQEGNFRNIDFQCVPKGAESVAVDRDATKATEDARTSYGNTKGTNNFTAANPDH
ncbi:hypothetical protein NFI96_009860, partial [Prochilodus magdalenae]